MKTYAFILALLGTTAAANAADFVDSAPPAGDWTGFYAGIQLGGAFGNTDQLALSPLAFPGLVTAFTPAGAPAGSSFNANGEFDSRVVGGVHVGYDQQIGNIVVGGILDVSYTDIGDTQRAFSRTPATYQIERELDYLATLRGRLGYAFAPRFMGYVTGGAAFGKVDFSYSQPGSAAAFTTSGGQDHDIGYTVGGGVEALLTEHISLGIEYLYTDLGSNDFQARLVNGPFGGATGAAGSNPGGTTLTGADDKFDFHTIQAKLSYRF